MNLKEKRILLLDDDPRYLDLLRFSLESAGMIVSTAVSGRALAQNVESFEPDVLIMDVMMGEQNGIEVARDFRSRSRRQDIPIIFVSAWIGVGELRLPENSIMLFKPFTPGELIKAIGDAIRGQNTAILNDE